MKEGGGREKKKENKIDTESHTHTHTLSLSGAHTLISQSEKTIEFKEGYYLLPPNVSNLEEEKRVEIMGGW